MLGFGWCHLLTSRDALKDADEDDVQYIDLAIDEADSAMFKAFREWMGDQQDPFLKWHLDEQNNNHSGLLTYSLSRNHRSSLVWNMLEWIRSNASSSYGLFYCHDDEDVMDRGAYDRFPEQDHDNVFRVHRLKNGLIEELQDPFFGVIEGDLLPIHPYNTADSKAGEQVGDGDAEEAV